MRVGYCGGEENAECPFSQLHCYPSHLDIPRPAWREISVREGSRNRCSFRRTLHLNLAQNSRVFDFDIISEHEGFAKNHSQALVALEWQEYLVC